MNGKDEERGGKGRETKDEWKTYEEEKGGNVKERK